MKEVMRLVKNTAPRQDFEATREGILEGIAILQKQLDKLGVIQAALEEAKGNGEKMNSLADGLAHCIEDIVMQMDDTLVTMRTGIKS